MHQKTKQNKTEVPFQLLSVPLLVSFLLPTATTNMENSSDVTEVLCD